MHDRWIKSGTLADISQIEYEGEILDHHTCGEEHPCEAHCEGPGICEISYQPLEKVWKNELGEFNYHFFLP
jgi:hypothetical protein